MELYLNVSNMSICLEGMVLTHRYNFVLMVIYDTVVGFSGSGENVPLYPSARPDLPTGIHHLFHYALV